MTTEDSIKHPLIRPRGYAGVGVRLALNGDEFVIVGRSREALARIWEHLPMANSLRSEALQGCIVSSANLISSAIEMASNIGEEGGE